MREGNALAGWGYDPPSAGGAQRGWAGRKRCGDALAVLTACPLRRRLIEGTLEDADVNSLAAVAMAGAAAEAMQYPEVAPQLCQRGRSCSSRHSANDLLQLPSMVHLYCFMCALLQTPTHAHFIWQQPPSTRACKARVLAGDGRLCARTSQNVQKEGGPQPRELRGCAQVTGQNADMADLQRLMMRGRTKLNAGQQQNLTVRPRLHQPPNRVLHPAGLRRGQQPHGRGPAAPGHKHPCVGKPVMPRCCGGAQPAAASVGAHGLHLQLWLMFCVCDWRKSKQTPCGLAAAAEQHGSTVVQSLASLYLLPCSVTCLPQLIPHGCFKGLCCWAAAGGVRGRSAATRQQRCLQGAAGCHAAGQLCA